MAASTLLPPSGSALSAGGPAKIARIGAHTPTTVSEDATGSNRIRAHGLINISYNSLSQVAQGEVLLAVALVASRLRLFLVAAMAAVGYFL